MKKYIAPQTEAIQLLGKNAIMAGSNWPNPDVSPDPGLAI
jgi:hypothetical protein